MPNIQIYIEIHGMPRGDSQDLAKKVFAAIAKDFPDIKGETVITLCDDRCFDEKGNPLSYFRISCGHDRYYVQIETVLIQFKMPIHVLNLRTYYPARE